MPMTSDAKGKLSKTIRALRERLLTELSEATDREYRMSVCSQDANLDIARTTKRKRLEDWLAEFKERENELVKNAVPNAAENLGVPHEDIEAYFHVIRRALNDEDLAGQELFLQELEKYKREPLFFMNKRGTNQL